jgi:hypothetical protein
VLAVGCQFEDRVCWVLHAARVLCLRFGVKCGDWYGKKGAVARGADWHSDAGWK